MQMQLVQQTLWVRAVIAGPWQGQWAVWGRRTGRGCLSVVLGRAALSPLHPRALQQLE